MFKLDFEKVGGLIPAIIQDNETNKVLIAGEEMRLNRASVALNIKVTLEKDGNLTLYSKMDDEQDFRIEGNCKLDVLPQSNYFGIVCIYSATRRNLFSFDDFVISPLTACPTPVGTPFTALAASLYDG